MSSEFPPNNPRAELEARLTAFIFGELPAHDAAALRQTIDDEPELAALYDRLNAAHKLVREATATPAEAAQEPAAPLRLSEARRQKLLAQFKTVAPKEFAPQKRRSTAMPMAISIAAVLAIIGLLATLAVPNFQRARLTARSSAVVNNLRQIDGAKQQWALETHAPPSAEPTVSDIQPYLGRGNNGTFPEPLAGENYRIGKLNESPQAEFGPKTAFGTRGKQVSMDAEGVFVTNLAPGPNAAPSGVINYTKRTSPLPAQVDTLPSASEASALIARDLEDNAAKEAAKSTPPAKTAIVLPPVENSSDNNTTLTWNSFDGSTQPTAQIPRNVAVLTPSGELDTSVDRNVSIPVILGSVPSNIPPITGSPGEDTRGKQHVFVANLSSAETQDVLPVLQKLFPNTNREPRDAVYANVGSPQGPNDNAATVQAQHVAFGNGVPGLVGIIVTNSYASGSGSPMGSFSRFQGDNSFTAAATNSVAGDPEWIGQLEHPDQRHSASNVFLSRGGFVAIPDGDSLGNPNQAKSSPRANAPWTVSGSVHGYFDGSNIEPATGLPEDLPANLSQNASAGNIAQNETLPFSQPPYANAQPIAAPEVEIKAKSADVTQNDSGAAGFNFNDRNGNAATGPIASGGTAPRLDQDGGVSRDAVAANPQGAFPGARANKVESPRAAAGGSSTRQDNSLVADDGENFTYRVVDGKLVPVPAPNNNFGNLNSGMVPIVTGTYFGGINGQASSQYAYVPVDKVPRPTAAVEREKLPKAESPRAAEAKPGISGIGAIYNGVIQNPQPLVETTPASGNNAPASRTSDFNDRLHALGLKSYNPADSGAAKDENGAAQQLRDQNEGHLPSQELIDRIPAWHSNEVQTATLVQDGKLLYEVGKFDEAKAKLDEALQADPGNVAAEQYRRLAEEKKMEAAARGGESRTGEALVELEKSWNPEPRNVLTMPRAAGIDATATNQVAVQFETSAGKTDSFALGEPPADTNVETVNVVGYVNIPKLATGSTPVLVTRSLNEISTNTATASAPGSVYPAQTRLGDVTITADPESKRVFFITDTESSNAVAEIIRNLDTNSAAGGTRFPVIVSTNYADATFYRQLTQVNGASRQADSNRAKGLAEAESAQHFAQGTQNSESGRKMNLAFNDLQNVSGLTNYELAATDEPVRRQANNIAQNQSQIPIHYSKATADISEALKSLGGDQKKDGLSQAYREKEAELQRLKNIQEAMAQQAAQHSVELQMPMTQMVEIVEHANAKPEQNPGLGQRIGRAFTGKVTETARIKTERDVTDVPGVTFSSKTSDVYDPYFVQTESEAIQSEKVLNQVIDKLKLDEAWAKEKGSAAPLKRSEALALLKKNLEVAPAKKNSSLLDIKVQSDKPEEAAKIANTIAEVYLDSKRKQREELIQGGMQAYKVQLAAQAKKVAQAEQELAQLRGESEQADAPVAKHSTNAPIPQPEIATTENPFSTFSLNISDVSLKLAAASLEKGQMPDPATIRSEEFINAFDYRDPEPAPGAPLAFAWERAQYPFAHNRDLLRFAIKTAAAGREPGRSLNIVLLLDKSGSMERADRVRIIHEALRVLATQLRPEDKISVVTFARVARLWVDGLSGSQAAEVADGLDQLTPEGGTNLEEAMRLAYETARRHYLPNGVNRVVLLTDGAANLGNVDPEALKLKAEEHRQEGIALDCFGVGWEGYNDDLLEVLSRNGGGRYGFINTPAEAATDFVGQLAGALNVAAYDVKVQVEFNPKRVTNYRQIGYAKHQLTKEQFRDNSVKAAQVAAAESGNALYAIEVNPNGEGPIATVRVRYRVPGTEDYPEHEYQVPYTGGALPLEQSSPAMRLAGTASAFSEWLASSPFAEEVTPDRLLGLMNGVSEACGADKRPEKLEWMIRQAKSLEGK